VSRGLQVDSLLYTPSCPRSQPRASRRWWAKPRQRITGGHAASRTALAELAGPAPLGGSRSPAMAWSAAGTARTAWTSGRGRV